jgi:hypothetical protein
LSELVSMAPGMEAWGRQQGCDFATINGRKGWARVFGKHGWSWADGELRKALR